MAEVIKRDYNSGKTNERIDYKIWWEVEESQIWKYIGMAVKHIDRYNYRLRKNVRNNILYDPESRNNLMSSARHGSINIPSYKQSSRYNVIKSNIDTVVSKISKNKPKIQFLTDGGNFKSKQKAIYLTKYVKGVFQDTKIYSNGIKSFRDGCIFGTGGMKIIKDVAAKKIRLERVVIDEIKVDEDDGMYGDPETLYQVTYRNKHVVLKMFPEHSKEIKNAVAENYGGDSLTEQIMIIEAWHLPSIKDGKSTDGCHVICIENATLFYEEWTKDYFPFVFCRWTPPVTGFFGEGIADELMDIQKDINRTLSNINRALDSVGKPRIWVPAAANVEPGMIANVVAQILKYSGQVKPDHETPTAMNQESYNHLYWLIRSSYEKTGVSAASATSTKEPGVNAAVAMRTMQDIESERFLAVAADYEDIYLDSAKIIIDLSRDLNKDLGGKLNVKVNDNKKMDVIDWSKCDLEEDRFIMQKWPVNLLPDKPEGKLQAVSEMMDRGLVDKIQGQRLLDYPDIARYNDVEFANYDVIDGILEDILYEGDYTPPEPYFDLSYALKKAQNIYNLGKKENAPEKNTALVLRFIDEVERLGKMMTPEQPEMDTLPQDVPPGVEPGVEPVAPAI